MGVASNRVDVHQAAAHAERALERLAEPLSALLLPAADFPTALLGIGWRRARAQQRARLVVRVQPRRGRRGGAGCATRKRATSARPSPATRCGTSRRPIDAPPSSTIVVNAGARTRAGLVTVPLPGTGPVHLVAVDDGTPCPTQVVSTSAGEGISTVVVGQKIRWVLEMMRGPELAGARIARVEQARPDDGTIEFTFHDAAPGEADLDLEATKETLLALGTAGETISIRQRRAPVREVVFAADPVPGFGWRTYRAVEGEGPGSAVFADERMLGNEHLPRRGRPGRRHPHHRGRRRPRHRRQPLRRRRRRRRHLQLLAAHRRHRRRPPRIGVGHGHRDGPGARPTGRDRDLSSPRRTQSVTERSCERRSDDTRHRDRDDARAAHAASDSSGCTSSSTTTSATTASGPTSRCRRR